MTQSDLYSKWSVFQRFDNDGLTYSIDKIVFTVNCGTGTGSDEQIDRIKDYFVSLGYTSKEVSVRYRKVSLKSYDGTHIEMWREASSFYTNRLLDDEETVKRTKLSSPCLKIRVHMNPNKLACEPLGFEKLFTDLKQLRQGIIYAVLNRVDYSVDIPGITPAEVLVLTRKRRCDNFDTTQYFGNRGSEQLKVYDKTKESNLDTQVTRLEWEVYQNPLGFSVKEEFVRMNDTVGILKYIQPHKITQYLSSLHHETTKKYKLNMLQHQIVLDDYTFELMEGVIDAYLHSRLGLNLTYEFRNDVDSTECEILLKNFKAYLNDMKGLEK